MKKAQILILVLFVLGIGFTGTINKLDYENT